ncbi:MAG: hypothetical protein ACK6BG_09055 [Cyanobacteriota bacterium]
MSISNPPFIPVPDELQHDFFSGSDDDPLTTAPPAPAEEPRSDNRPLWINPLGLLCKMLPLPMSQPAPLVPC